MGLYWQLPYLWKWICEMKRFATYQLNDCKINRNHFCTVYGLGEEASPYVAEYSSLLNGGDVRITHVYLHKTYYSVKLLIEAFDRYGAWTLITDKYVDEAGKLCFCSQASPKSKSPHKCECPSRTLLLSGCKCGGI